MVIASASSIVLFTLFLLNINRGYYSTFFTTMTAKKFYCQKFQDATTDQAKIAIFSRHYTYYVSIRSEVKDWVHKNWAQWNEEKPEWFTTRVIAGIPVDMIPNTADEPSEQYES